MENLQLATILSKVYMILKKIIYILLYIFMLFVASLIFGMVVDLSTSGLRFTGDYTTYYWSDVFHWIGTFF